MRRRATAAVVVWALSVVSTTQTPRAQQSAAPAAGPALEATLGTYCVTCHNNRLKSGGLSLDARDGKAALGRNKSVDPVVHRRIPDSPAAAVVVDINAPHRCIGS